MLQLQMIDTVKTLALKDENVSAVFMYGSFTKNEGDQYSDIEFYIFLKDQKNFSSEQWVNQIHPVALFFTNEYGSEVAIFENLVRGEFHFLTTDDLEIIKSWEGVVAFSDFDQMNVVDKEGLLVKTLDQIEIKTPERTTGQRLAWLGESLVNVLLTTGNLIKRGEFAHAHQSLSNVQKYVLWLIRIATGKTQHWESPTKSLEKEIGPEWYSAYGSITSDLQVENLRSSFKSALEISEKLFEELNIGSKLKKILRRIDQNNHQQVR